MLCCLYKAVYPLVWAVYGHLSYLMLYYMGYPFPYIMSWVIPGDPLLGRDRMLTYSRSWAIPWRDGVVPTAADSGADGATGTPPQ